MKIQIQQRRNPRSCARSVAWWAPYFLIAVGIAALGYCGIVLGNAGIYQFYQNRLLDRALQTRGDSSVVPSSSIVTLHSFFLANPLKAATVDGAPWGRVELARLGLSAIVSDGDDDFTLQRGVGHIPGTALPGVPGNVGLAAHRDTYFRPLERLRMHDDIVLTTLGGVFKYRVQSTEIVEPNDVQVLDPGIGESLTLVTCYPFGFIGSAPQRFIVHARRVSG